MSERNPISTLTVHTSDYRDPEEQTAAALSAMADMLETISKKLLALGRKHEADKAASIAQRLREDEERTVGQYEQAMEDLG